MKGERERRDRNCRLSRRLSAAINRTGRAFVFGIERARAETSQYDRRFEKSIHVPESRLIMSLCYTVHATPDHDPSRITSELQIPQDN